MIDKIILHADKRKFIRVFGVEYSQMRGQSPYLLDGLDGHSSVGVRRSENDRDELVFVDKQSRRVVLIDIQESGFGNEIGVSNKPGDAWSNYIVFQDRQSIVLAQNVDSGTIFIKVDTLNGVLLERWSVERASSPDK